MNAKQFTKIILNQFPEWKNNHLYRFYGFRGRETPIQERWIGVSWIVGGDLSGSCWDLEEGYEGKKIYVPAETEPGFPLFYSILAFCLPENNVTSIANYNAIVQESLMRGFQRKPEFYGNYTDYAYKYFTGETLFNALQNHNQLGSFLFL